jgi:hypothetical protein
VGRRNACRRIGGVLDAYVVSYGDGDERPESQPWFEPEKEKARDGETPARAERPKAPPSETAPLTPGTSLTSLCSTSGNTSLALFRATTRAHRVCSCLDHRARRVAALTFGDDAKSAKRLGTSIAGSTPRSKHTRRLRGEVKTGSVVTLGSRLARSVTVTLPSVILLIDVRTQDCELGWGDVSACSTTRGNHAPIAADCESYQRAVLHGEPGTVPGADVPGAPGAPGRTREHVSGVHVPPHPACRVFGQRLSGVNQES